MKEEEPYVFEGAEVVETDEVVSNVADEEITMEQAIDEATKEHSKFLKAKDIEENKISVIKIIEVPEKAYRRSFGDRIVTRADLIVEALDGKTKGTRYIFSIGVYNLKKLSDIFGKDFKKWVGKKVVISKETRGTYDFVGISAEYKLLEG